MLPRFFRLVVWCCQPHFFTASTMVSLGRSSLAFLLSARSSSAFLVDSRAAATRRAFFTAGGCLVAASLSVHPSLASRSGSSTCDSSSSTTQRMASSSSSSSSNLMTTGYLNAADAAALDVELMSTPGFCLEQLMELAGLSVAEAVYQVLPPQSDAVDGTTKQQKKKILLICGPGNNGGDGLVAARHLVFFGYDCVVVYPKRPFAKQPHFENLVTQCQDVGVPVLEEMPSDLSTFDGMVDAIFGFSFKGEPREPFATALKEMQRAQNEMGIPVISVDVPSGWNVNEGDVGGTGFMPQVLVSLTTPKESAKSFSGRHFVGGRFLPPQLAEKYNVRMPPYPGVSQVMEVTDLASSSKGESSSAASGWEAEYAEYLAAKEAAQMTADNTYRPDVNDAKTNDDESWEAQYAAHCAEKEARLAEEDQQRLRKMKEQQ